MRNHAGGRLVEWELADASSLAYLRKTAIVVVSYTRAPKVGLGSLDPNHQNSRGMNSLDVHASARTCPVGCICPRCVY